MRIKIILIFILSILIPTALLAHFGLQAVKSEKAIVERSMMQRYEAVADVVENDIKIALKSGGAHTLSGAASAFKGEAVILDRRGRVVGGYKNDAAAMVLMRPVTGTPYTITVYEQHPELIKVMETRKKELYSYIAIIIISAVVILGGGAFTLWNLSRQWTIAELKGELVAGLSHDLRRPLTSIRMFSEMLSDGAVPTEDKKREYYRVISNESEQLTNLANNILDFSRMESGRKRYSFKYEDIAQLTAETVERFRTRMLEPARRVVLKADSGIPKIKIDADAVAQALINLLSNAAKYSPPEEEITVNLVKTRRGVAIEVIDKGIGVPKKEHKRIFEKFYRVVREETDVGGAGLGLALVRHIAEAHRGKVTVESESGRGSKFSLVLPV